jgi:hypothetical protein
MRPAVALGRYETQTSDSIRQTAVQLAQSNVTSSAFARENVIVSDSVVHRWGVIESEGACRAILTTADGVPGVKRVENRLEYPVLFRPDTWVRPATRTRAVEAVLHLSEHFCAAGCHCYRRGAFYPGQS